MPETSQPNATKSARLADGGLNVTFPKWEKIAYLLHGTTTRQALPQGGKADLFEVLKWAAANDSLPDDMWMVGADQVHETEIAVIDRPLQAKDHPQGYRHDDELGAGEFPKTDALITTIPGVLLVIRTADCLPLYLLDRERRICALAHCGWRGLYGGLAERTARRMIELGAVPAKIEAWLGPAICAANYEVSADLVQKFKEAFSGAEASSDGPHLDINAIAKFQLEKAGVSKKNIAQSGECTRGDGERYHSYRASGEQAGRMLSFIGFRSGDDETSG